jgi:hypothetical protein
VKIPSTNPFPACSRYDCLTGRKLAILVLPSNQVPFVARLVPAVETLLATIQPGTVVDVPLI